ncbi:MFS transporter [Arthrobacter zhaoxinii]|uniref:MFS transporter n=1 Tax=Arthrobacter zhaoxinii TaxID=2964616 RepID=A0ABY5YU26_9MICC|nr:MFS transporter [Arthrobacter zhaoxinii]UWX98433.1 MFS transporter [Arthrobacter zhaoxinii]
MRGGGAKEVEPSLRRYPAFVRFWLASTVSDFGTYTTTLALSVLVLVTMNGTTLDQGLVNAARWAPYLLFGLVAGIWIDRFPRRTVLVGGDIGRAVILVGVCVTAAADGISVPVLLVLMFAFGLLALTSDAAYQSFLPQLVPRPLLTQANARLQQSDTAAQATGTAFAGGLVALVTAPVALLFDAVSYLLSAAVLLTLERPEPLAPVRSGQRLHRKIAEGLDWVYGHAYLGPLAWSTHLWFIGSAILGAVLPAVLLLDLGLGALGMGLVLGCAGIGAVIGTTLSTRLGTRWGTGRVIVAARLGQPVAVVLVALAPFVADPAYDGGGHGSPAEWPGELWAAFLLASAGQFLFGLAMGAEGPLEMGYRQAVTPDRLIARMSATMRSVNRGMIVIGAPLGGTLAAVAGTGTALWAAAGILLLSGFVLLFSKFRNARTEVQQLFDGEELVS